jgi:hypothetical protein
MKQYRQKRFRLFSGYPKIDFENRNNDNSIAMSQIQRLPDAEVEIAF